MNSKTVRSIIVGAALFLGGCSFASDALWPSLTGDDPAAGGQLAQQAQAPAQAPSTPAPTPQVTAQTPPQPGTANFDTPGATSRTNNGAFAGRRPLVVIRFDRENVAYEQALYSVVSRVLERRPNAAFDLVAVAPAVGGAARQALNSDRARRNAENVLGSLQRMGLPTQRVEISARTSAQATTNEVHLYLN